MGVIKDIQGMCIGFFHNGYIYKQYDNPSCIVGRYENGTVYAAKNIGDATGYEKRLGYLSGNRIMDKNQNLLGSYNDGVIYNAYDYLSESPIGYYDGNGDEAALASIILLFKESCSSNDNLIMEEKNISSTYSGGSGSYEFGDLTGAYIERYSFLVPIWDNRKIKLNKNGQITFLLYIIFLTVITTSLWVVNPLNKDFNNSIIPNMCRIFAVFLSAYSVVSKLKTYDLKKYTLGAVLNLFLLIIRYIEVKTIIRVIVSLITIGTIGKDVTKGQLFY